MDCSDDACSTNSNGSIRVSWDGQTGCKAYIRGFPPLAIDMPVRHGGTGKHPCPHDILLAAIGSCFLGTFLIFQRQLRLKLVDLQIAVEGSLEQARGGKSFGKYELAGISLHVEVAVEGSEDEQVIVADCLRLTGEHCPITRALQDSIPITLTSQVRMVSE